LEITPKKIETLSNIAKKANEIGINLYTKSNKIKTDNSLLFEIDLYNRVGELNGKKDLNWQRKEEFITPPAIKKEITLKVKTIKSAPVKSEKINNNLPILDLNSISEHTEHNSLFVIPEQIIYY
jgi:hypothetical protein